MGKPRSNYFLVNRRLLHSERWLSEPFTKGQAWVDMFGLANHAPGFYKVRGIQVDVNRGQLAYSQEKLAERWRWSRGKIRRYIKELEISGEIVQQNGQPTNVITIVNYEAYQNDADETVQQAVQQTVQQNEKNSTHKKNDIKEEVKEEDSTDRKLPKISFDPDAGEFTGIINDHREKWGEVYPDINLDHELFLAAQWLIENPRKKYKSYIRFLAGWFNRAKPSERKSEPEKYSEEWWALQEPRLEETFDKMAGYGKYAEVTGGK